MKLALNYTEKEVQRLVTPLLSLSDLFSFYANNQIPLRHIPGGENPAESVLMHSRSLVIRMF